MRGNVLTIIGYVISTLLISGCAQMGTLSGGPRDTTPPKLVLALPELKSTSFNSEKIILKFDENIQLKDLNNQLAVSPKLQTKPEITAYGKTITIKLKNEELLPNTTYRIYFGSAVADMHEGNSLSNFTYIFSTGNFIDTLSIKGQILNAFKKTPEKDIVVGLYYNKNLEDSFPFKQTPDYVTRSSEKGEFKIENLSRANYRLICFTDKNKDYLYNNPETDMIGFVQENIKLDQDTSADMLLFNEIPDRTYIKKQIMTENGKGMLIFNKPTEVTLKTYLPQLNSQFARISIPERDTCTFFYRNMSDSLWLLASYNSNNKSITDTLMLKIPILKSKTKKLLKFQSNISKQSLPYFEQPILEFNQWIDTSRTDLSKIKFKSKQDTSIQKQAPKLKWIAPNKAVLTNAFLEKGNYRLKLDTGAFVSFNGLYNDSAVIDFSIQDKKQFASLLLNISFNLKQAYIVSLIDQGGNTVKQDRVTFSLSSSNTQQLKYTQLNEGIYTLNVIYDNNSDGKWNTGNYLNKQQPEKIYVFEKPIKAIPNWELEEDFILKE